MTKIYLQYLKKWLSWTDWSKTSLKISNELASILCGKRMVKWRTKLQLSGEVFMWSRECCFGVYFPRCETTMEINTEITLDWAHEHFATAVHTLFYFLHDMMNLWLTIQNDSHTSIARLTRFVYVLLMTSQMHYATRQLWREHVKSDIYFFTDISLPRSRN